MRWLGCACVVIAMTACGRSEEGTKARGEAAPSSDGPPTASATPSAPNATDPSAAVDGAASASPSASASAAAASDDAPAHWLAPDPKRYAWLATPPEGAPAATTTMYRRFAAPPGYARVQVEAGSYGDWLRGLPLAAPGTPVVQFDGQVAAAGEADHLAAVVAIDPGTSDTQTPEDMAFRLQAEFLWSLGRKDSIGFRSATGLQMPWGYWESGMRLEPGPSGPQWQQKGQKTEGDYADFRRFTVNIATWLNALALEQETVPVAAGDAQPGDFFLWRDKKTSVVVVLADMAVRDERKIVLPITVLEPTQSWRVLRPGPGVDWFQLRDGEAFVLPELPPLEPSMLRRFRTPAPKR